MTSPLANLRDLLAYAATRSGHDRADKAVLSDLAVGSDDLGLPDGVDVRWLGVAGFAISYEGTTILIDPYVRCVTPMSTSSSAGSPAAR